MSPLFGPQSATDVALATPTAVGRHEPPVIAGSLARGRPLIQRWCAGHGSLMQCKFVSVVGNAGVIMIRELGGRTVWQGPGHQRMIEVELGRDQLLSLAVDGLPLGE